MKEKRTPEGPLPVEALLRQLNRQALEARFPGWEVVRGTRSPDETDSAAVPSPQLAPLDATG